MCLGRGQSSRDGPSWGVGHVALILLGAQGKGKEIQSAGSGGAGRLGSGVHKTQQQYLSYISSEFGICREGEENEKPREQSAQRYGSRKNTMCLRNGQSALDPAWGQGLVRKCGRLGGVDLSSSFHF